MSQQQWIGMTIKIDAPVEDFRRALFKVTCACLWAQVIAWFRRVSDDVLPGFVADRARLSRGQEVDGSPDA